jgi:formylglycine-generating enzyme required for sulfatase activity
LTQGYWLADTTITQAFWEAVMGANPSHFKGTQRPVEQISWDDTQAFIQKLQQYWQLLDVRLPLEAEWECACRAGTTTAFSFGGKDDLNIKQVNYFGKWDEWDKEGKGETKPVKSYPPNAWGLYEMHGNVWEWCQDEWQDDLGSESVTLSPSPSGRGVGVRESPPEGVQGQRVVRGGSWNDEGGGCRSAYRRRSSPASRGPTLGCRLALGHPSSGQEQSGSKHGQARYGVAPDRDGSQTAVGGAGQWLKSTFNKWRGK